MPLSEPSKTSSDELTQRTTYYVVEDNNTFIFPVRYHNSWPLSMNATTQDSTTTTPKPPQLNPAHSYHHLRLPPLPQPQPPPPNLQTLQPPPLSKVRLPPSTLAPLPKPKQEIDMRRPITRVFVTTQRKLPRARLTSR
ncbi:hypothetical protein T440DRAFT_147040 [Plenodomus tracheiphilus IPT5]|uniref:Uncharacterized protein n=1 Tax=Plenodomus tracheiphilus IPT5 TaxID=1408161 RepID=A0A6A7B2A3_9PLEO|nr:hypothetical protein T440DRAFT_147040 [Plenodomus tracheiphilus IPT5]